MAMNYGGNYATFLSKMVTGKSGVRTGNVGVEKKDSIELSQNHCSKLTWDNGFVKSDGLLFEGIVMIGNELRHEVCC